MQMPPSVSEPGGKVSGGGGEARPLSLGSGQLWFLGEIRPFSTGGGDIHPCSFHRCAPNCQGCGWGVIHARWCVSLKAAPLALQNPCPWLWACDDCEELEDDSQVTDSDEYIATDAPAQPAASDVCQAAELEDWVVVCP